MANFVQAGKTGELQDGTMKKISIQGHQILLAKVGNKYCAADNRCPHMGGNLSQGKLEGTVVTCPRHGSQFDLSNGQVIRWLKSPGLLTTLSKVLKPPRPLKTYNIQVEDEKILIEI